MNVISFFDSPRLLLLIRCLDWKVKKVINIVELIKVEGCLLTKKLKKNICLRKPD